LIVAFIWVFYLSDLTAILSPQLVIRQAYRPLKFDKESFAVVTAFLN
jgi:hypothetical protein